MKRTPDDLFTIAEKDVEDIIKYAKRIAERQKLKSDDSTVLAITAMLIDHWHQVCEDEKDAE